MVELEVEVEFEVRVAVEVDAEAVALSLPISGSTRPILQTNETHGTHFLVASSANKQCGHSMIHAPTQIAFK